MTDGKSVLINNSSAEFLTFTGQSGEECIEYRCNDEILLSEGIRWWQE